MKDRIRFLRKTSGLTQTEFGVKIGVKTATVSGWEGPNPVPESAIISICREFNVRREWLEKGFGEIFEELTEPTQTPEEFAKKFGCDEFTAGIFARYCRFSDDNKAHFSDILKALIAVPDSVLSPKGGKTGNVLQTNNIRGSKKNQRKRRKRRKS